ncbi:MAG: PA14 domain-containing protein [Cyclobacteriaceae bacterium]
MLLKYLAITFLLLSFSCSQSRESKRRKKDLPGKELNALQIILKNDCLHCHSIEDKVVGPPYLDISRRHSNTPGIKSVLSKKIVEGGGGLWYGGMMSGHPLLKQHEVNKIVDWILSLESLKNEENLSTKGLTHDEVFVPIDKVGFSTKVYPLEFPTKNLSGAVLASKATYKGTSPVVDMRGSNFFHALKAPYLLKIEGKTEAPVDGKYFFRLNKTGQGELKLDGKTIITNNEWDKEIALEVSSGLHDISLYYSGKNSTDTLSLSWIVPGDEYYTLIPFAQGK